jgi:dGTP triphosphohydrolase
MSTQTQPAALPPKLEQLLATMADVDKIAVLRLAQHYRMDLDDPGFLPLLLTREGIAALEKARDELAAETDRTINMALQKASEAIGLKATAEAETIRARAADAEAEMKAALAAWAEQSLQNAVREALASNASSMAEAQKHHIRSVSEMFALAATTAANECTAAARAATAAVQQAEEAARNTNFLLATLVFLSGGIVGTALTVLAHKVIN